MFYLKEFLKITKENIVISLIFLLCSISLITIAHNRKSIQAKLSLNKKTQSLPYFKALISGQSKVASVMRRMKQLPGVVNVKQSDTSKISDEVSHLKKSFGEDVISGLATLSYQQIKIELESGIRQKSHSLIREYLTRLVGGSSITIGNIKFPQKLSLKSEDPLVKFLNWVDVYTIGIVISLWIMSAFLLLKSINVSAFIIEKFQRRKFTNIKILLSGTLLCIIPAYAINYLMNQSLDWPVFSLMMIMIIFSITLSASFKRGFRA